MLIEKNNLPDFVIAQLYGSHLVLGPDITTKETKPVTDHSKDTPTKLNYLGNNAKQISILVKESDMLYINEKDLQFLSAILNACKLNVADVAIINFEKTATSFEQLKKETAPKYVLLFDVSPKEIKLPFTIPHYQVQTYDQCQFIFAPALASMDGATPEAKTEKTKLWTSLKIIFQL